MHHRHVNRYQQLEQRLNQVLSKAQPKKSPARRFIKSALCLSAVLILTAPLWLGIAERPRADIGQNPTYYKIKKVTIEYPEGLQPTITLTPPARSGCAHMPATRVNTDNTPKYKI
jgi:hypothetical protein